MMLGEVISVKSGAVVCFGDFQAILVELRQRPAGAIEVIEYAEFHDCPCYPIRKRSISVRLSGNLSRPSTASIRASCCAVGMTPRVNLWNLPTISSALANDCS